jgi:hypothetical protein
MERSGPPNPDPLIRGVNLERKFAGASGPCVGSLKACRAEMQSPGLPTVCGPPLHVVRSPERGLLVDAQSGPAPGASGIGDLDVQSRRTKYPETPGRGPARTRFAERTFAGFTLLAFLWRRPFVGRFFCWWISDAMGAPRFDRADLRDRRCDNVACRGIGTIGSSAASRCSIR